MTVYFNKRRRRWCYDFVRNGKRYFDYCSDPETNEPARNKTEAKNIEQQTIAQVSAGRRHDVKGYSVAKGFAAYAAKHQTDANWTNRRAQIAELVAFFGAATQMSAIDEAWIDKYVAASRATRIKIWMGGSRKPADMLPEERDSFWKISDRLRADSTTNRYLDCLRETIKMAAKVRDPMTGKRLIAEPPDVPELTEPEALPRPITREDLEKIIAHCPDHLADAIALTVMMGFRRDEVFSLEIDQIDFDSQGVWLVAEATKAGRGEFMHASPDAMAIFSRLVAQAQKLGHKRLILALKGKKRIPVKQARRALATALKNAGLAGKYTFHDTKATFSTTAAMSGLPQELVQKLSRHKDYRTTQRYIFVADQLRRDGMDLISAKLAVATASRVSIPRQKSQTLEDNTADLPANLLKKMVGVAGFEPTALSPPD